MTNEEKIELRREVCARMLYGLKALATHSNQVVSILRGGYYDDENYYFIPNIGAVAFEIDDFKMYLRQMSSMTEEEYKEWRTLNDLITIDGVLVIDATQIDWLNAHHFDYRGLIEKGLALEAPEGMYDN